MEYSVDFAERLIEAAEALVRSNTPEAKNDAARTIVYLSRLSCEISIKAALESAGFTIKDLKNHSHNFKELLKDISHCRLEETPTEPARQASMLLAVPVATTKNKSHVAVLLMSDEPSRYPNEIRYGSQVKDFCPLLLLDCARVVAKWVRQHSHRIRIDPTMNPSRHPEWVSNSA